MNNELKRQLDRLSKDYQAVTGNPFSHFFCPILHRDEATDLCDGHVINAAFRDSDRCSTVQRSDVDSFFGSKFEADFVLLQQRGKHDLVEVILDRGASRQLRPRLIVDGKPLDHYLPEGSVPSIHSELEVHREGKPPVRLALKLEPSEALAVLDGKWEIAVEKDVRLPALVSLLKAAHLTLFDMMGYSYALSASGRFLGWDILGKFVAANVKEERSVVHAHAREHFVEFVSLVRPMISPPEGLKGTVSDHRLFLCTGTPKPWAFMVFVRTADQMHAVLVPIMEDDESAARFVRFLRSPSARFEIKLTHFRGDRWEVAKTGRIIEWPAAAFG